MTNIPLIKQAVLAAEANARQTNSHTKTRGNVRGGGRKPWKQKGTGNARAGSRRSPVWVGGGITFGPQKERTFKQAFPKKMAKAAFVELLNHLNAEKQIVFVDSLALSEAKTKAALKLIAAHQTAGRLLLITDALQAELVLACRNLPGVEVVQNKNLSILQLVKARLIVMEKVAAESRDLLKPETKTKASTGIKPKKASK